ncbi:hypothetical protein [Tautonia sociabilis]|uniref:Uncharacterized protein n=1 Tax=Tautonia sociabilis TaxID=2080755 RepID=A0A432MLN5_9BACT|nr:hypothetical protein [Tautonia sociabilis]RUL88046.1 hypothetical protein TsocGM_08875 [Tautonia sociabilis]
MTASQTEAEALLQHGALYPIRLGIRPSSPAGPLVFAGFKHGAFSLYFGDEPSYHFDLEGRWQRCYLDPSHFLRRLDGSTQAIDRPRVGPNLTLDRRTLDRAEADAIDEEIRGMAADLAGRIASGACALIAPPEPTRAIDRDDLLAMLGRISSWDAIAWAGHRDRYRATFGPIPFLPPDALDAVVLQATVGGESRSLEGFSRHCRDVAALLGLGAVPLRTLFLSGPDVLRRPAAEVEGLLLLAREAFPLAEGPAPARRSDLPVDRPHRDGILAFLGPGEGSVPEEGSWARFRSLGLSRVAVGLSTAVSSSSADAITPRDDLLRAVPEARRGGLSVSVVVWIDPDHWCEPADVAGLIRSLGLGKGDHVYLVDGREQPGRSDGEAPGEDRDPSVRRQEAALRDAMAPMRREAGVKVLPYSVKKQGIW